MQKTYLLPLIPPSPQKKFIPLHYRWKKAMHSRPYNPSDPLSIFAFSGKLIGNTLSETLHEMGEDLDQLKNEQSGKGGLGVMVEKHFFGYEPNSDARPDFYHAGLELKVTPLKKYKNGDLAIKERLVCDMIDYFALATEEFEDSRFFKKSVLMLILFYLHINGCKKKDLRFIYSVLWTIKDKDLQIIKQDFLVIREKVRNGLAHEISEGDTMYLGACRKGHKGQPPRKQPFCDTPANARAFSFKTAYLRTILDFVMNSGKNMASNLSETEMPGLSLVTNEELEKDSFDNILINRFSPYIGLDYKEISNRLGLEIKKEEKSKYARVTKAILQKDAVSLDDIEEIQKSGLKVKTIRIQKNGNVREHMSFNQINYSEILEAEDWIDSEWYDIVTTRYLFVIYREVIDPTWKEEKKYVLDKMFFWTMPASDYKIAEDFWLNIKNNIINDTLSSENTFWRARDKKYFHVRPKARNSFDLTASPVSGKLIPKKAYWFNNDYLRKEIIRAYGDEWVNLFD